MKIDGIKIIKMANIDLSNNVRYCATINKSTLVQYSTDGIFRKHLNKEEFIKYIKEEYKRHIMTTHNLEYKSVNLEVTGTYYSGFVGTYEQPPERREFEIERIDINGVDCTELLEDEIDSIETDILEQHYS